MASKSRFHLSLRKISYALDSAELGTFVIFSHSAASPQWVQIISEGESLFTPTISLKIKQVKSSAMLKLSSNSMSPFIDTLLTDYIGPSPPAITFFLSSIVKSESI